MFFCLFETKIKKRVFTFKHSESGLFQNLKLSSHCIGILNWSILNRFTQCTHIFKEVKCFQEKWNRSESAVRSS